MIPTTPQHRLRRLLFETARYGGDVRSALRSIARERDGQVRRVSRPQAAQARR